MKYLYNTKIYIYIKYKNWKDNTKLFFHNAIDQLNGPTLINIDIYLKKKNENYVKLKQNWNKIQLS